VSVIFFPRLQFVPFFILVSLPPHDNPYVPDYLSTSFDQTAIEPKSTSCFH
jgi:hypothetical protein